MSEWSRVEEWRLSGTNLRVVSGGVLGHFIVIDERRPAKSLGSALTLRKAKLEAERISKRRRER